MGNKGSSISNFMTIDHRDGTIIACHVHSAKLMLKIFASYFSR